MTTILQDGFTVIGKLNGRPIAIGNNALIPALRLDDRPAVVLFDGVTGKKAIAALPSGLTSYNLNDHSDPGLLRAANGKILCAWSMHGGSQYLSISENADDPRTWGSVATVAAGNQSYNQLALAADPSNTIYWFYRNFSTSFSWRYRTSTDNGVTWGGDTEFFNNGGEQPYFLYWPTSGNRIDFLVTTTNPGASTKNSIYHGYLTISAVDGSLEFFKSDGTSVGGTASMPFSPSTFTLVHDATTNDGRHLDVCNIGGTPVILYGVFSGDAPTSPAEYWQAVWNGSSWDTEKIADCGTTAAADVHHSSYLGSGCLDPQNANIVYLSREYGSGDFRMEQWTKSGGTWSKTVDVSGASGTGNLNVRPRSCVVNGTTRVAYSRGTYTDFSNFDMQIELYPDASFESSKPATPVLDTDFSPPGLQLLLPLQDGSGTPTDLLGNYTLTQVGSGATWGSGTLGGHLSGFTAANYYSFPGQLATDYFAGFPRWQAFLFTNTSTTASFLSSFTSTLDDDAINGIQINNPSGSALFFVRGNTGANLGLTGTATGINDGNPHTLLAVEYADNNRKLYFDGLLIAQTTSSPAAATFDRGALGVLRRNTVNNAFTGQMYAAAMGTGAVPHPEEFHQNWVNGWFSEMQGAVATIPDAPTTYVATAAGSAAIDDSWTDNSADETGFRVYQSRRV